MEISKPKEYQTIRLFAILGLLTLMTVLLFKVVLFVPQNTEIIRLPADSIPKRPEVPNLQSKIVLKNIPTGQRK